MAGKFLSLAAILFLSVTTAQAQSALPPVQYPIPVAQGGALMHIGAANQKVNINGVLLSQGTAPTISGCGGSVTGGGQAGKFTSSTTGTCTPTLTFNTASNTGWACQFADMTTVSDVMTETASTTTTVTASGTTVSGGAISYFCLGW